MGVSVAKAALADRVIIAARIKSRDFDAIVLMIRPIVINIFRVKY